MGILDDAIREHLDLKRQHGADESVLKQLEGEAFGPAERPGSGSEAAAAAEAPTEFMQEPQLAPEAEEVQEGGGAAPAELKPPEGGEEARIRRTGSPKLADLQEGPDSEAPQEGPDSEEAKPAEAEPEAPKAEAEAPEPAAEAPEQPEQPAEQPEQPAEPLASAEPPAAPEGTATEERQAIADHPTELYDVEGEEFGGPSEASQEDVAEESIEEEEDDFFDEKRLSDELDQALDAPLDTYEDEPEDAAAESEGVARPAPHEDLLEETPDFLEEAPEDDQLWFEQKPPKDFDFDD